MPIRRTSPLLLPAAALIFAPACGLAPAEEAGPEGSVEIEAQSQALSNGERAVFDVLIERPAHGGDFELISESRGVGTNPDGVSLIERFPCRGDAGGRARATVQVSLIAENGRVLAGDSQSQSFVCTRRPARLRFLFQLSRQSRGGAVDINARVHTSAVGAVTGMQRIDGRTVGVSSITVESDTDALNPFDSTVWDGPIEDRSSRVDTGVVPDTGARFRTTSHRVEMLESDGVADVAGVSVTGFASASDVVSPNSIILQRQLLTTRFIAGGPELIDRDGFTTEPGLLGTVDTDAAFDSGSATYSWFPTVDWYPGDMWFPNIEWFPTIDWTVDPNGFVYGELSRAGYAVTHTVRAAHVQGVALDDALAYAGIINMAGVPEGSMSGQAHLGLTFFAGTDRGDGRMLRRHYFAADPQTGERIGIWGTGGVAITVPGGSQAQPGGENPTGRTGNPPQGVLPVGGTEFVVIVAAVPAALALVDRNDAGDYLLETPDGARLLQSAFETQLAGPPSAAAIAGPLNIEAFDAPLVFYGVVCGFASDGAGCRVQEERPDLLELLPLDEALALVD